VVGRKSWSNLSGLPEESEGADPLCDLMPANWGDAGDLLKCSELANGFAMANKKSAAFAGKEIGSKHKVLGTNADPERGAASLAIGAAAGLQNGEVCHASGNR
jgi:hypothetical protein